ncbi:exported hypothetical protein [Candidatus Sulfotelmatomonas gaucii]|uniref:Uncharacterized protein n=1 Tax=Candidatus Sulfuritelmatomonas gaucii TaxID=2043161 RepID=A0A2N9LJQ3_9BACT|nr:exported hypothetical protein [Candidatus Sulfotelmatomonas gaucii]
MHRFLKIAIAVVLLIVVAAVLISPAVDLEPAALRAALWVAALFASFGIVRIELCGTRNVRFSARARMKRRAILSHTSLPLFDLYGARLC